MREETARNIEESYENIKLYMDDEVCIQELREMCSACKNYRGKKHNYEKCRRKKCFEFWLAFKYLEWSNSY